MLQPSDSMEQVLGTIPCSAPTAPSWGSGSGMETCPQTHDCTYHPVLLYQSRAGTLIHVALTWSRTIFFTATTFVVPRMS